MNETRYAYRPDKRTRTLSILWCAVVICLYAAVFIFFDSGYFRAWTASILTAVLVLFILSIPKYIKVTATAIEIHCLIELTKINMADVADVREISPGEDKPLLPLLGSYGFFGYYGYFLNIDRWDTVKVYASRLDNLIEITDIYEQSYIVSCDDPGAFAATVRQARGELPA